MKTTARTRASWLVAAGIFVVAAIIMLAILWSSTALERRLGRELRQESAEILPAGFAELFTIERAAAQEIPAGTDPDDLLLLAVRVTDPAGAETAIDPLVQQGGETLRLTLPEEDSDGFVPGTYEVEIDFAKGGTVYTGSTSYTLGVLAVNLDQARYTLGDMAYVQLAALDALGHTICDASLLVQITRPGGIIETFTTNDNTISSNSSCGPNNVTDDPDYSFFYPVAEVGGHQVAVQNLDTGFAIEDAFVVASSQDVRIQRSGATRINPFRSDQYVMQLLVESSIDQQLDLVEVVPEDFVVTSSVGEISGNEITFELDLLAGVPQTINYVYGAPKISPYMYLLGPATLSSGNTEVYVEGRQWQLASDAAGDFAIFREAAGGEVLSAANTNLGWDTTVNNGSGTFGLTNGNTRITTAGGHHLIMYSVGYESASGANRNEIQSEINLINGGGGGAGTDQVYGRSTCYIRRANGVNECWLHGAAILDLGAGERVRIQAYTTDDNTATVDRRANDSGITILQLDDAWDYAIVQEAGGGQTFNATTWATVDFDTNDELDAGTFSRTGGDITLAKAGHYLVTYNVMFQNTGGATRRNSEARLTLDNTEIPGTRVSSYIRGANGGGNSQSVADHAATYVGIIESASDNQVLRLEGRCETSCGNMINVGGQTGITIAKLPDSADYIRLYETGGGQVVDGTNDPILWDTQAEVDTDSFSHSTVSNTSRIEIDHSAGTDDYLFTGAFYSDRTGTASGNRHQPRWEWRLSGATTYQYGSFGKYNRASSVFSSGNSGGIIADGIANTDYIELINTDESTTTDAVNTFQAERYAVQGVNLTTLFATAPVNRQKRFRWRAVNAGAEALNSGTWGAAEDTNLATPAATGEDYRVRIQVANDGTGADAGRTYELQYGLKATTCSLISTWTGVGDAADAFDMVAASGFAEGAATTTQLTATGTFTAGEGRETADTTGTVTLPTGDYTELEYSFEVQAAATRGATYCFRVFDTTASEVMDVYEAYPELTINTPVIDQNHYRFRAIGTTGIGLNDNGGGDWEAAEDTDPSDSIYVGEPIRLRFSVANTGTTVQDAAATYQLQFANKDAASCDLVSTWTAVDASGADDFASYATADFTEGASTTALLTATGTFIAGDGSDTDDVSASIGPLNNGEYTEVEYAFSATTNASTGASYCFRLYDSANATTLDTYSAYPQITLVGGLRVQRITGTLSGATSVVETIPMTLANVNNTFLMFDFSGEDNGDNFPNEGMCSAYISSTTQVTVEKGAAAGGCIYAIYVIEALNGEFAVRARGEITVDGAELSDTGAADGIASINDTSRVFVTSNQRSDANNQGEWNESYVTTELTNATTVTTERAVNTGNDTTVNVRYEVVEWLVPGVSVQTGETTLTNLNTTPQTAALGTAVDLDRSFVYANFRHTSNGLAQTSVVTELTSTDVSFLRSSGATYTSTARWWVIEFPQDSVTVQRGSGVDATGGNNDIDETIPVAVNQAKAWPVSFISNSGTGTAFPRGRSRSNLDSGTNLSIEGGYNGNTANFAWQVIDTSGWMPGYLTLSVSDNAVGFGEFTDPSTEIRYATGDSLGSTTETTAHTVTVQTNAEGGYKLYVEGPTLTHSNATNTIAGIGGTSAALAAGTEAFGLRVTASGGLGTASAPYDNATQYAYAAASGTPDEIAASTVGNNVSTTFSLIYGSAISAVTAGGEYATTLTYIVVPEF